jgi:nucleotide-binding universal stress UspA family protein
MTPEGVVNEWNYEPYRQKLLDSIRHIQPVAKPIPIEYRVEPGDPGEVILRVAAELDCAMIVMGSAGKNWLERLVLGSTAEQVLRAAVCPVLIVKAKA